MFVLELTYTAPESRVDEFLAEHVAWLDRQYAAGVFLASGRKVPRDGGIILAVVVGLLLHALMYSPQAAFFSELFGTSVRYTGASVGYQLASIGAGAVAPLIAVALLKTGDGSNTTAVGWYVAITSVITIVAVACAKETRNTSLRHDRVVEGAHS